jgi:hypothetical protein
MSWCYNFPNHIQECEQFSEFFSCLKSIYPKNMVFLKNVRDLLSNVCTIGKCIGNYPYALCHEDKKTG